MAANTPADPSTKLYYYHRYLLPIWYHPAAHGNKSLFSYINGQDASVLPDVKSEAFKAVHYELFQYISVAYPLSVPIQQIHPFRITEIFPELPMHMQMRDLYGILYPGDELFTKSDVLYLRWKQIRRICHSDISLTPASLNIHGSQPYKCSSIASALRAITSYWHLVKYASSFSPELTPLRIAAVQKCLDYMLYVRIMVTKAELAAFFSMTEYGRWFGDGLAGIADVHDACLFGVPLPGGRELIGEVV